MANVQSKNNSNKFKTFFKKNASVLISICLAVIMLTGITLAIVLPLKNKKTVQYAGFKIPALNLPIEERFALTKYGFDSLGETITTLRQDRIITKHGLPRATTSLLPDEYTIENNGGTLNYYYGLSDQQGNPYTFASASKTIDFDGYYLYPGDGLGDGLGGANTIGRHFSSQAEAMFSGDADAYKKYGLYYKYMLLSQGYNITKQSQNLAVATLNNPVKQAEFKSWLKKHPSADLQYGEVVGTNNAVEKQITLDPIYRAYHATGLYLPAGEAISLKIENLNPGESISVVVALQNSIAYAGAGFSESTGYRVADTAVVNDQFSNYFTNSTNEQTGVRSLSGHSFLQSQQLRQNNRMPWIHATFTFSQNGTYCLGTPFGGIMHIAMNNCYSQVKTTFTGAVETPHYILGVTTPQYYNEYLRNAPGVVGVLDTENGQLVGPVYPVDGYPSRNVKNHSLRTAKTEEIEKLAMLWHSFFSVNESFTGGTYNRANIVKFDQHVPAGAAVALGGYNYACPTGWFYSCMSYNQMTTSGNWGTLHEIGHNHASSYGTFWGFGDGKEGEVHNNALNILCYILFTDIPTSMGNNTVGVEHGEGANPYTSYLKAMQVKARTVTDYSELDYFDMLNMYTNIMHSFSGEKFYELLYTYKQNGDMAYRETDTSNRRSGFAYRCALVYGMNFTNYFNDIYKANITEDMYTADQLAYLKKLPNYNLIACKYAGGIDGIKTGGDYLVNFGQDIQFDLLSNTKSMLDTADAKGFRIINVNQPQQGVLQPMGKGVYKYVFNRTYHGTSDQFSFTVKLNDGVIHKFTVYLRISYNQTNVISYSNLNKGTDIFKDVEEQVSSMQPSSQVNGSVAGTGNYSSTVNTWELKIVDFYWKAPRTGKVTFTLLYDDAIKFYFGPSFDQLNLLYTDAVNSSDWKEVNDYNIHVLKGNYYAIRLYNVNTGGPGKAYIGCSFAGEPARQIPLDQIYHPYTEVNTSISKYKFEPTFMVSKKDGISVEVTGTDKTKWEVIEAPALAHGGIYYNEDTKVADTSKRGHYEKHTQYILPPEAYDEYGNEKEDFTGSRIEYTQYYNMWDYLIDGNTSTCYHTPYSGGYAETDLTKNPHVFVIDTKHEQTMNFFSVTTRANVNSYINLCELYVSQDNTNWHLIKECTRQDYQNNTILVNFKSQPVRYLKVVVKKTSGGSFSVLSEIDAGIKSHTQKLVSATSSLVYATKKWQNTNYLQNEKNGYLLTEKKNQNIVVKFKGCVFTMYGTVDKNYGKLDVKIDGNYYATVDCDSSKYEARKLLLLAEGLEDSEHTVEIITKDNRRVMINMFGVDYVSTLINAPNIYKEKALTITIIVFVVLFAVLLTLVLCLLFIPKFRNFMGGNRAILWLDKSIADGRAKRKAKRAEKKAQKAEEKRIAEIANGTVNTNEKPKQTNSESKPSKSTNKDETKLQNTLPKHKKTKEQVTKQSTKKEGSKPSNAPKKENKKVANTAVGKTKSSAKPKTNK